MSFKILNLNLASIMHSSAKYINLNTLVHANSTPLIAPVPVTARGAGILQYTIAGWSISAVELEELSPWVWKHSYKYRKIIVANRYICNARCIMGLSSSGQMWRIKDQGTPASNPNDISHDSNGEQRQAGAECLPILRQCCKNSKIWTQEKLLIFS